MDTGSAPHFDGTNYPYWRVRMASYLEAVGLDVWRVTKEGTKPLSRPANPTKADEKEIHFNVIARNALFGSLSIVVLNRVYSLSSADEIWQTLKALHDGTSDVKEQKLGLVRSALNSFTMLPNELANDMYSCLNVIVNEFNSIGDTKLSDADVARKIIEVLPSHKYVSITTYLLNQDLSTMTPTKVLGKIIAFEHYHKIGQDTSSSKSLALTIHGEKKMEKGKSKKEASSSSSEEEDEDSDEDDQAQCSSSNDDEEIAMLIKRMDKALKKLNSKGIPITIEDIEYNRQRKKERKGGCFGCGEKGHFMDSCPTIAKEEKKRHKLKKKEKERRERHKALISIGKWVDVSSDEDHHKKHSHKSTSRKSSSTSHKCLMAKGKSDVSDDDDAPSYDELVSLVREQRVAIIGLKCKNKSLKDQLASSSTNYEELVLKFDMVVDHNDELTKKIEALELKATCTHASTLSFEK